jgi:hypothetical protein
MTTNNDILRYYDSGVRTCGSELVEELNTEKLNSTTEKLNSTSEKLNSTSEKLNSTSEKLNTNST